MAFATASDVAARLGRALTRDEEGAVEFLLAGATAVIEAAVERSQADIDPGTFGAGTFGASTVPTLLRFVAVEVVVRAMANPSGLASRSEALGAASRTDRFREGDAGGGLWLTQSEELMVRRAVIGQLSGTSYPESIGSDTTVLATIAPSSYELLSEGS